MQAVTSNRAYLAFSRPALGWPARLAHLTLAWHQRRQLAALGDHALHDLGLTRGDVERELARPWGQQVDWAALDAQRRLNSRRSL